MKETRDVLMRAGLQSWVHDGVAKAIREEAAKPEATRKSALGRVLGELFKPDGYVLTKANETPGFAWAIYMAGLERVIFQKGFIDKLPGDSPIAGQVKAVLKLGGPAILHGLGGATRDAARDIQEKVDSLVSDADAPVGARKGRLDELIMVDCIPGQVFVPMRDKAGNVLFENSDHDRPVVYGGTFNAFRMQWDGDPRHQAKTTKKSGGKKGDSPIEETTAATRLPWRWATYEEATECLAAGGSIAGDALVHIKAEHSTPGTKWGSVSPRVIKFLEDISLTAKNMGFWEQFEAKSLFEDWEENADVALLEHLAKRAAKFERNSDGTFMDADYDMIIFHADAFMGGHLNPFEKITLMGVRAWRNRRKLGGGIKAAARGIIFGIGLAYLACIFLIGLFARKMVEHAFFTPVEGVWTASKTAVYALATWFCVWVFIGMTRALLRPIAKRFFGAGDMWLSNTTSRFGMMLLPIIVIAIGLMPWFNVSFEARFLIVMLVIMQSIRGLYFVAAGRPLRAKRLLYIAATWGWLLLLGIIVADAGLRHSWEGAKGEVLTVGGVIAGWFVAYAWPVLNTRFAASVILFGLLAGLGVWILRRLKSKSELAIWLVIMFALAVAVGAVWFKWEHKPFDLFELSRSDTASSVAPVTTTIDPLVRPLVRSTKATSRKGAERSGSRDHHGHTHAGEIDCSLITLPEHREAANCP